MPHYEYRVIAAPERGKKVKGAKSTADRFAVALQDLMNEMGAEGWEYQRTDTLPCQERVGLTGKQTSFQHMLVFRREKAEAVLADEEVTALLAAPVAEETETPEPVQEPGEAEEVAEETRDALAAARDAAAALSARAREGKAPALGPAKRDDDKKDDKTDYAAE